MGYYMKLIAGCWVSGCLVFGLVSAVLAKSPGALDFEDRFILGERALQMAPVTRFAESRQTNGALVWDNGGFITHPGAGVDGADISMASQDENSAGSNVRQWEDNEFFRVADRFEVADNVGIVHVSTFAYEPIQASPAWTSKNLRIWSGSPGETDSEVLFEREYDSLDVVFTGVYRVLHLADLTDVRRPIYEVIWDITSADQSAPLWLEPGEYWIDWQVVGGETGWSIYVMEPNPDDLDQPTTVFGDSLQLQPDGWAALNVATPFLVFGLSDHLFSDRFEALGLPETEVQ